MSRKEIYIIAGGCLLALCGLGALVAGISLIAPKFTASKPAEQREPIPEVVSIVPGPHPKANGNSMGDPDAPIKIEEFSDFQCPYCRSFHENTEAWLVSQYVDTGKVHFSYRSMGNFISDNIGGATPATESQDAALAAYCAGDQNKFWEMQSYLFANVLGENAGSFTDRRIQVIAEKAGLDMAQFTSCYESDKYIQRVKQDFEDGRAAGIAGVPSFLLTYRANGATRSKLIQGAQPLSSFQQQIDDILDEIGAQ